MNKSMERRASQLGMHYSTASGRLKKAVMLDLVQKLELDKCFRCGKPITNPSDLSIDHKIDWQEVSAELFWDVGNIAFSHNRCNRPSTNPGGSRFSRKVGPKGTAWCCTCKQFLDVKLFAKHKGRWNGFSSDCYPCRKKQRSYKERNWRKPKSERCAE